MKIKFRLTMSDREHNPHLFTLIACSVALVSLACLPDKARLEARQAEHHRRMSACRNGAEAPWPYFPVDRFDQLRDCWYGDHLRAMNEPPLVPSAGRAAPAGYEAYRLLWLRTFHRPIAVRIERYGGAVTLVGVRLNGTGGYAPGDIEVRTERALASGEFDHLARLVVASGFWTNPPQPQPGEGAVDGAEWILEGVRDGKYQLVDLWTGDLFVGEGQTTSSPGHAAFLKAALQMLDLAGLRPPSKDIY